MKLLLENWRNYILLENIETAIRLSIFDFDETIAYSDAKITVTNTKTGEQFDITTQKEFDELSAAGGYDFDFSSLENVYNAVENRNITDIIRERLSDPQTQVMVLTAREMTSIDDIHRVLESFDEPIDASKVIMIGLAGQNKAEYLKNVVLSKYPNIKEIEFYDDSKKNIAHMQTIKNETSENSGIEKFDIYHVIEGNPNLT